MSICRISISCLLAPALLAGLLAGCERKGARVYLIPKEPPAKAETGDPHAGEAQAGTPKGAADPHAAHPGEAERGSLPTLSGIVPPAWKDLGADGMSAAKFQAGEATVTATPLPSMEGKESVPVNLWRAAMGQPPLDEAAALAMLTELPVAGQKGKLFDLTGERTDEKGQKVPTRIVTAFLHRDGATWFFKLQGTPPAVEPQVAAFKEFLSTVRFEEPGTEAKGTETAKPAPPSGTNSAAANSAPPAEAPAVPGGTPAGWSSLPPGPMQAAKFSVPEKDGAKAEVAVSIFPGDTGGTLANVRRWRGQMGLPDADDATVQASAKPLEGGPSGALVVDLENNGRSFVGAIVPRGGSWYFYKLVGGAPAVASARESFIVFARAQ